MRILILHSKSLSNLPSGEAEVASYEEASLNKYGNTVKLLSVGDGVNKKYKLNRNLSALMKNIWFFKAAKFVRSNMAEFKPDVVHFHGLFPYLSASALGAAHKSGVLVIQTLHNGRWLCLEGGFYRDGKYCDDCISLGGWTGVKNGCKHGKFVCS